jgi:hypothetical protein
MKKNMLSNQLFKQSDVRIEKLASSLSDESNFENMAKIIRNYLSDVRQGTNYD